ncbi:hypothetical protein [Nesterenkonia pannonica]|uniref:hypothetical protein n=1 Tax=Nesterenkonia pannonica TaxID=1548602 RepID=UPI00216407A9|nr:hypothetical protein [Nesterenkonia pannonica]
MGTEPTAAAVQVPLFVVGDGRSTVRELVTRSFEHRRRNRALALALPREVTLTLITAADLTLDTVLGHKELRILRRNSDLFTGMLPVDVTAVISAELTEVARQAAASVPGYGSGSVDILTSSLRSAADAAVFGMDPAASMRMHAYPALGSRQGIGRHISEQFRLRSEYWDQSFSPALLEWDELE